MPPKAKPDTAAYQKLKKDIKEGTIGTLYVFHGEEAYLRDFYLGQLKKKLLPAGMEEFNLHTLSGKEFDVKTLAQLVDCLPMMSERTLIVVNDYDIYKGDKDALAAVSSSGQRSSGAAPVLLSSPPMFTSSRTFCTMPALAASFSIAVSRCSLPTLWIRLARPRTFLILLVCRCPMKWLGLPQ